MVCLLLVVIGGRSRSSGAVLRASTRPSTVPRPTSTSSPGTRSGTMSEMALRRMPSRSTTATPSSTASTTPTRRAAHVRPLPPPAPVADRGASSTRSASSRAIASPKAGIAARATRRQRRPVAERVAAEADERPLDGRSRRIPASPTTRSIGSWCDERGVNAGRSPSSPSGRRTIRPGLDARDRVDDQARRVGRQVDQVLDAQLRRSDGPRASASSSARQRRQQRRDGDRGRAVVAAVGVAAHDDPDRRIAAATPPSSAPSSRVRSRKCVAHEMHGS